MRKLLEAIVRRLTPQHRDQEVVMAALRLGEIEYKAYTVHVNTLLHTGEATCVDSLAGSFYFAPNGRMLLRATVVRKIEETHECQCSA